MRNLISLIKHMFKLRLAKEVLFSFGFIYVLSCSPKVAPNVLDFSKIIQWSDDRKVEYNDFKAKLKPLEGRGLFVAAVTSSGIYVNPNKDFAYLWNAKYRKMNVAAFFDNSGSWFDSEHKTKEILEHEQIHFDISETIARRFRKELVNNYQKGISNQNIELEFQKFNNELFLVQDEYDRETNHGRDSTNQQKWVKKIKSELTSLNDFKESTIHLKN